MTFPLKIVGILKSKGGGIPRNGLILELLNGSANDTSGNGNNGTISGAVLATGRKGVANTALSFDGISDRVVIPYSSTLFNSEYSYSGWVNLTSFLVVPTANNWIINSWSGSSPRIDGMFIYSGASPVKVNGINYTGSSVSLPEGSPGGIVLSTWYHIVFCHGLTSDTIYINGVPETITYRAGSFGAGIGTDTPQTYIGGRTDNSSYLNGLITDIRKYDRELTQSEVTLLYNE